MRGELQKEAMVTNTLQYLSDSEKANGIMTDEARKGQISILLGHALEAGLHSLRWEALRDFGREDTLSI